MKTISILFSLFAMTAATYAAMPVKTAKSADSPMRLNEAQLTFSKAKLDAGALVESNGDLQAGFTVLGAESGQQTAWSENFDGGSDGWTLNNADDLSWELKQDSEHPFTEIDPDDTQSLFINGLYLMKYQRGTASAISPAIEIPGNATFTGYIGYSYNLADYATMTIFASENGEDWTRLWSCLDDKGDPTWRWHYFSIDLTAYAGKTVQFKFEYGNSEAYDNGGYMADYIIDGLQISTATEVTSIDVMTGETVKFADASEGNVTSWQWSFPGGTPSKSTEQYPEVYYTRDGSYDVSLTVGDGTGTSTKTITGFVNVTGVAPTAKILPPATFRYNETRLPMIAPFASVQYHDASAGFPTDWEWVFTGVSEEPNATTTSTEENPEVSYAYQHKQAVGLTVSNQHGSSSDMIEISAEYEGFATNLQPGDRLYTFDLDNGYGEFPGTNYLEITEYAEKFSKPSVPISIEGVTVYFTQYQAEELLDQLASIKVALCKSENGLPGEQIDFASWDAFELDMPQGNTLVGTDFEFSKPATIDDEFFIVVSGIPEKNETCTISFATAKFREQGNTAYFKQDGKWKAASDYFPAGNNHTSYAVSPYIAHSVMAPLSSDEITVGPQAGETSFEIFSYFGYQTPIECDADWCRVTSDPNGMTVDNIVIAYDELPENVRNRTATLTLTDGASSIELKLTQDKNASTATIEKQTAKAYPAIFDTQLNIELPDNAQMVEIIGVSGNTVHKGQTTGNTVLTIDGTAFAPGAYIIKIDTATGPIMLKAIKR